VGAFRDQEATQVVHSITSTQLDEELVVLLDDAGSPIGTAAKATVHDAETPLHLAFSCHVVDAEGRVLVTRRALFELGAELEAIEPVLPDFRYRAVDASGIVEHEVCPVYRARIVGDLNPNPAEVAEFSWTTPDALRASALGAPFAFSPWLVWQLEQGA
jgi:isopentenyl-diphosphate delta-isomerase